MSNKKYSVGIVPGSFDPITYGHLDIIKRAAELCERVVVAVMINDRKQYMFSLRDRLEIAKAACEEIGNVTAISSHGMLFELARDIGAEVIIKGVRNDTDREYELKMAAYNSAHYPLAKTLLLDANETLVDISSTSVRALLENKKSVDAYLPEKAIMKIKNIMK